MKLLGEIVVTDEKLTRYMLQWRPVSDKSKFLLMAGYSQDNWQLLQKEIRELAENGKAIFEDEGEYGVFYSVAGSLHGPNEKTLHVRTIWMKEHSSNQTRFITLYPL